MPLSEGGGSVRPGPRETPNLGGRVTRTGLAVVHKNEIISPSPGSEAEVAQAEEDLRLTIHYHLPVEVEIVGALTREQKDALIQSALAELRKAVERRTAALG